MTTEHYIHGYCAHCGKLVNIQTTGVKEDHEQTQPMPLLEDTQRIPHLAEQQDNAKEHSVFEAIEVWRSKFWG